VGSTDNGVRFRAVATDGRRSTTWRVFDRRGKSDLYIVSVPLGELAKVSLHESGCWRTAFVTPDAAGRYLPPNADRAFDKFFEPSEEIVPGWIEAYTVLLPDSELQPYGAESSKGPVVELASPGPGGAVMVTVLIGNEGAEPPAVTPRQQLVGTFGLANGRTVRLVAETSVLPDHLAQAVASSKAELREAAVAHGFDPATAPPVHPLICADAAGNRLVIETAAWSIAPAESTTP
jgi:hypothetical protein